ARVVCPADPASRRPMPRPCRRHTPPTPLGTVLLVALLSAGCRAAPDVPVMEDLGIVETLLDPPVCTADGSADPVAVDTLATGLSVPWDLTFLDDGRALFTEREGRIRVISAEGVLDPVPWAELPIYAQDEIGLMGIDARRKSDG